MPRRRICSCMPGRARHSGRRRACYSRGPLRLRCGASGTAGWEGDDGPTGGPREALENVERRFLAWWSGGDEQTGLDGNWIGESLGMPPAALEGATVADL